MAYQNVPLDPPIKGSRGWPLGCGGHPHDKGCPSMDEWEDVRNRRFGSIIMVTMASFTTALKSQFELLSKEEHAREQIQKLT